MEQGKQKKKKWNNQKAITLIALVVTIIVLIILAGVSINLVLGDNGIITKAKQAKGSYSQAQAREKLEMLLVQLQTDKVTNSEYNQEEDIDRKIEENGMEIEGDIVIVDGWQFEIDRSIPAVVDCVGPADGIIITAKISGNNGWVRPGDSVTLSGTIKTYSGGTITNVTATNNGTEISNFPTNGGDYNVENITEDTDIIINATDSKGKTKIKTIKVRIKRDTTGPTIKSLNISATGLKITIDVTAEDLESGLKEINYAITPTTGLDKPTGKVTQGNPVTITSTIEGTYTVGVIAKDNLENISEPQLVEVETIDGGVIKHIKTPEGLKEVNTKNIYGAEVTGYTCDRTDVNWQIFYIDEEDDNRVYLIAKDYVVPPVSKAGLELLKGGLSQYPKAYRFGITYRDTSILERFTGTIPNTPFTTKFLSEYAGTSALRENLQAINYMLDQTIWAEYLDSSKAEYSFGGPTLPLFIASYNDICKEATKLDYRESDTGYQINVGGNSFVNSCRDLGNTYTQKGIYFKGSGSTCGGYWIASPSTESLNFLMGVDYSGGIGYSGFWSQSFGFCPLVSLKSSIRFTANADGSYTINQNGNN